MSRSDPAVRLLHALRAAGCACFIEDDQFFCSPPLRAVDWHEGDVEEALDEWHDELRALVQHERVTIH